MGTLDLAASDASTNPPPPPPPPLLLQVRGVVGLALAAESEVWRGRICLERGWRTDQSRGSGGEGGRLRRRSKSTTRESSERATSTHSRSDMVKSVVMREKVEREREREMGFGGGRRRKWGMGKGGGLYRWGHGGGLEVDGHVHYFLIYSLQNSITLSLYIFSFFFSFFFSLSLFFPFSLFSFPLRNVAMTPSTPSHFFVFFSLLYSSPLLPSPLLLPPRLV